MVYTFDETDFDWSNSHSKSQNKEAVNDAYRKIIPSYPLHNEQEGVYQSFVAGNVLFLVTDSRTFLDQDKGILLGLEQTNWLKNQLTNAATDDSISAIILTFTQPWIYVHSAYDWDMIKQNYVAISDDMLNDKFIVGNVTRNLFNFNRPNEPNFKSMMMIQGGVHTAFDDGSFNYYGNFPVAVCGTLDHWLQCRGGPYSHGSFHDSYGQFCNVKIYQRQVSENKSLTCINVAGIIPSNDEKKAQDTTVYLYDTCTPDLFPGRINLKCPIDYKEKILNAGITIGAMIIVYVVFMVIVYNAASKALSYQKIKDE